MSANFARTRRRTCARKLGLCRPVFPFPFHLTVLAASWVDPTDAFCVQPAERNMFGVLPTQNNKAALLQLCSQLFVRLFKTRYSHYRTSDNQTQLQLYLPTFQGVPGERNDAGRNNTFHVQRPGSVSLHGHLDVQRVHCCRGHFVVQGTLTHSICVRTAGIIYTLRIMCFFRCSRLTRKLLWTKFACSAVGYPLATVLR